MTLSLKGLESASCHPLSISFRLRAGDLRAGLWSQRRASNPVPSFTSLVINGAILCKRAGLGFLGPLRGGVVVACLSQTRCFFSFHQFLFISLGAGTSTVFQPRVKTDLSSRPLASCIKQPHKCVLKCNPPPRQCRCPRRGEAETVS